VHYFKSISDRDSRSEWRRQPTLATLFFLPGRSPLAALPTTGEAAQDNREVRSAIRLRTFRVYCPQTRSNADTSG